MAAHSECLQSGDDIAACLLFAISVRFLSLQVLLTIGVQILKLYFNLRATSKSFFKALHESSLLTFSAIFYLLVIHPAVEDGISLDSLLLQ